MDTRNIDERASDLFSSDASNESSYQFKKDGIYVLISDNAVEAVGHEMCTNQRGKDLWSYKLYKSIGWSHVILILFKV